MDVQNIVWFIMILIVCLPLAFFGGWKYGRRKAKKKK